MTNYFEIFHHQLTSIEGKVDEVLQRINQLSRAPDEYGGVDLAVEVTRLSRARVYALVANREIPHMKRGNRLTFSRRELTDWIQKGKRSESNQDDYVSKLTKKNQKKP